jgi:hypothetical protein
LNKKDIGMATGLPPKEEPQIATTSEQARLSKSVQICWAQIAMSLAVQCNGERRGLRSFVARGPHHFLSAASTAMKAFCGVWTWPICFIFSLPFLARHVAATHW